MDRFQRKRLLERERARVKDKELEQARTIQEDLDSEMELADRDDLEAGENIEECLARLEELTGEERFVHGKITDLEKRVTSLGVPRRPGRARRAAWPGRSWR